MFGFFQTFLKAMANRFRRIARATKNELSVDDLHNDAWILAQEIGEKRGHDIDFSNPEDADLIIAALHVRNVKRGDWHMRGAVRIDQQDDDDDTPSAKWVDLLPAPASSDPLASLVLKESSVNEETLLAQSYSQASAYVRVFVHFKNDRREVCAYLVIHETTLRSRVTSAAETVKRQPSIFDGVHRIEESFMPPPGRQICKALGQQLSGTQWGWTF